MLPTNAAFPGFMAAFTPVDDIPGRKIGREIGFWALNWRSSISIKQKIHMGKWVSSFPQPNELRSTDRVCVRRRNARKIFGTRR